MNTYGNLQLTAFADEIRQALLERLQGGPLPVVELARGLRVSRPAVSQHLRVLLEAQLVQAAAAGTRRFYRLDPRGFAALRAYLDGFWGEALGIYKAKVERD